jgi:hemolysin III
MSFWSRLKEPFCALSHLTAAALSVIALAVLLILSKGRPWHFISFAIYGASLIFLFTASGLYHSISGTVNRANRWQRLDHTAIYLLIAGTYTPVCLVSLRGPWGWSLLGAVYGLALVGIVALYWGRWIPGRIRVVLYSLMGWLVCIAIHPLQQAFPPQALSWLVAGGVVYTVGMVIYATDWPHLWPGKFTAHDLWHLCVIAGSVCHYILIARYIA